MRCASNYNTARASLGETKDGITDGAERKYFSPALAAKMHLLCRRATVANLRFLKSLRRPDQNDNIWRQHVQHQ